MTMKTSTQVCDVTLDVAMWPEFYSSTISMRETQYIGAENKHNFETFQQCGKRVKLEARKLWKLIPAFGEVTEKIWKIARVVFYSSSWVESTLSSVS